MTTNAKGYFEKYSMEYRWKINEIESFIKSAKTTKKDYVFIKSPEFSTSTTLKDSWNLGLVIQNDDESSKKKSWFSPLLFSHYGFRNLRTQYLLFFLNNRKEKIVKGLNPYDELSNGWINHLFDYSESCHSRPQLIKIDELLEKKDEFFQNDTWTVGIELIVYDEFKTINNISKSLKYYGQRLAADFKDLSAFKNKCDIIKVGDEKFDAYKVILSARSCFFDAMFSHDMKENKENHYS